jgi:nucleoside-diphosphate-sugar epimerase
MYINGINGPLGKALINFFQREYEVNSYSKSEIAILNGFKSPTTEIENNTNLYKYNVHRLNDEIEKIKRFNLKKIIFISAVSVYGDTWDGLTVNASPHPSDFYSLSKLECESILSKICKEMGVTFYTIRVPGICEPFCTRNFICKLITKIKNGEPPSISSPNNYFNNLTCHEDICNLINAIIENKISSNIVNIGSTNPIRVIDIVELICNHYGRKFEYTILNPTPERIINVESLINSGVSLNSVVNTVTKCLI